MSELGEFDNETEEGLPESLPAGEKILWQGAPAWQRLAYDAFHLRKLVVYFLIILIIQSTYTLGGGQTLTQAAIAAAGLTASAMLAVGLFGLIAWLMARASLYTITDKRLVMRIGAAISLNINIPFQQIDAAALRLNQDGSGDIPLTINQEQRISYFLMWPHVRPWQFKKPEPMLRGIPCASEIAEKLSEALQVASASATESSRVQPVETDAFTSSNRHTQATAIA